MIEGEEEGDIGTQILKEEGRVPTDTSDGKIDFVRSSVS